MEEIWERLPSHAANLSPTLSTAGAATHLLCRLPDPGALPLAEVLALRERLERAGILHHWWQTVAASLKSLQVSKPASMEAVQVAAGAFLELWPTRPSAKGVLELKVNAYSRLPAITAFALATGLRSPSARLLDPEGKNGVSLLLAPERSIVPGAR
jgi:hypothetical protein